MKKHKGPIVIEVMVQGDPKKIWEYWTSANHIMQRNNASEDWFTPHAENNLQVGGTFKFTMMAKDGSEGFDFEGTYTHVKEYESIEYSLADARHVKIIFTALGYTTKITESFDPETINTIEQQRQGRQAILNNFKTYVESSNLT